MLLPQVCSLVIVVLPGNSRVSLSLLRGWSGVTCGVARETRERVELRLEDTPPLPGDVCLLGAPWNTLDFLQCCLALLEGPIQAEYSSIEGLSKEGTEDSMAHLSRESHLERLYSERRLLVSPRDAREAGTAPTEPNESS